MQDKVLIGRDIGPVFNELFMRELTESESDRETTEVKRNEQRMENELKQKDVVEGVESEKEKHETVVNDGIILVTREQEKKEAEEQRKIEQTMKAEGAVCKYPEVVMLEDELSQNQEEVRENISEGKVHTVASENGIDLPVPVLSETDNDGLN